MNDFSIALVYTNESAGTWSLFDLAHHRGVIDHEDLEPEDFYEALGDLCLYQDRFFCFLRAEAGKELHSYVVFLVGSLAALSSAPLAPDLIRLIPTSSWNRYDRVVGGLWQEDGTRLVLQDAGSHLTLAFYDRRGQVPEHRLSPYFEGISITHAQWKHAAIEALDEYVRVAEERIGTSTGRLRTLVELWRSSRPVFVR